MLTKTFLPRLKEKRSAFFALIFCLFGYQFVNAQDIDTPHVPILEEVIGRCINPVIPPPPPPVTNHTLCDENQDFQVDDGFLILTPTFASTLIAQNNGSNFISGKDIQLHNVFIIDTDITFSGCRFLCFGSAQISIVDNSSARFSTTDFFSCTSMWEGILLQTGSRLSLTLCEIEDAHIALTADEGALMQIAGTKFNRNGIGIQNGNGSILSNGMVFQQFVGNRFTLTSPLLEPPLGGTIGISFNQTAAVLGGGNKFINLATGIELTSADLSIHSALFDHITDNGIDATGGALNVRNSDFISCTTSAVQTNGSMLNCTGNTISGTYFVGINSLGNGLSQNIDIANNDISMTAESSFIGIAVERSFAGLGGIHNKIEDNTITINRALPFENPAIGIFVADAFLSASLDAFGVFNNTIDVLSNGQASTGIWINGGFSENYNVSGNDVTHTGDIPSTFEVAFSTFVGSTGIFFNGLGFLPSMGHEITDNNLTGVKISDNVYNMATGILVQDNPFTDVCDNFTNRSHQGVHFKGNCDQSMLSSNDINNHQDGLLITPGFASTGVIGFQVRRDNSWTGTTASYDDNAAEVFGGNPLLSLFIVQNTTEVKFPQPLFPPVDPNMPLPSDWFRTIGGTVNPCTVKNDPLNISAYEEVIMHELENDEYINTDAWRFNAKYGFMQRLLTFPEIAANNSDAADFLANPDNNTILQLATAENMIRDAFALVPITQSELDNIQSEKAQIIEQIDALLESQPPFNYDNPEANPMDEALIQETQDLMNQLSALNEDWENAAMAIQTQRQASLTAAKVYISNIATSAVYEDNLHSVLLNTTRVYTDEISLEDYLDLMETIYLQDPLEAGIAHNYVGGLGFEFCEKLDANQSVTNNPAVSEENTYQSEYLKIFPNPANNHINITFPAAFTGKIYLTDLTGKFVNQVLEVRETTAVALPLENMPHGVYILNAIDEEHNFSHQEKIIVQR